MTLVTLVHRVLMPGVVVSAVQVLVMRRHVAPLLDRSVCLPVNSYPMGVCIRKGYPVRDPALSNREPLHRVCCVWTAVRRRQQTAQVVARAAVLAAVVITVAGLLAMHALSLHGTGSDGEHATLSVPAAHVEHVHALEHADHGASGYTGHPGGEGHTAMMLCAAFLLAAGALLLSGLWRRTRLWWFARTRGWSRTAGSTPFIARPATGPPPEWAFSVIRC